MMNSLFEQNGGTYSVVDDYLIPALAVPDESVHQIGIWGKRRLDFLKRHRRVLYVNLLTSGKLHGHLHDIDAAAFDVRQRQSLAYRWAYSRVKAIYHSQRQKGR